MRNMRVALRSRHKSSQFLVTAHSQLHSYVTNQWGVLPSRITRFIDRPQFPRWRYEWTTAIYYGPNRFYPKTRIVQAFWNIIHKMVERFNQLERLAKERVELAVHIGRRRAENIRRTAAYLQRIDNTTPRLRHASNQLRRTATLNDQVESLFETDE